MNKRSITFSNLFAFAMVVLPFLLLAQNQAGSFTVTGAGYSTAVVTDYQCLGVNPANLGWKRNNHVMNVGVGEASFSIYSEPLKRALVDELFNADKTFTQAERDEAVENFTNSKLQLEGNASGFGFSFQDEKIGGFGFAVKERVMWDSNLNEESADILFNGYNADYFDEIVVDTVTGEVTGISNNPQQVASLFEGTRLELLWFREFNFSYGRSFFSSDAVTLYGGIGFKYLKGYSVFNYNYENGAIDVFSALNPLLDVDYDTPSPSEIENNQYQSIGEGYGMDFGISALILNKLRVAFSVTDIGSIKWDGNVYTGENAKLDDIQTSGIDNYNIFSLDDNVAFDNLKWGGWEGLDNKTTDLPTNIRSGAALMLNKKFEFGTEFYIPLNETPGSYDKLIFGIGTRIQPVKWFRGSIGVVSGGATGTDVPVGISFFPFNNESFSWEMGLAVRDITTYFQQDKPTVAFALGLLRFSFGQLDRPTGEDD